MTLFPMQNNKKILLIRLSSLGDVILSTTALTAIHQAKQDQSIETHFLVGENFKDVLSQHPFVSKLWTFDKRLGLKGWLHLASQLHVEKFDHIYDLHQSLRTLILRVLFWIWKIKNPKSNTKWKVISKQRLRYFGFYLFKNLWPKQFRPTQKKILFAQIVGGDGSEMPQMNGLLSGVNLNYSFLSKPYICVMPASKWEGKQWNIEGFLKAIEASKMFPVVLGTPNDSSSVELVNLLKKREIPHFSGVGGLGLKEVAFVLKESKYLISVDTGLTHLAEAFNVPVHVVFGPTHPDMGFGPIRERSKAYGAKLWCRPCSKDGTACFRLHNKYACMKKFDGESLIQKVQFK